MWTNSLWLKQWLRLSKITEEVDKEQKEEKDLSELFRNSFPKKTEIPEGINIENIISARYKRIDHEKPTHDHYKSIIWNLAFHIDRTIEDKWSKKMMMEETLPQFYETLKKELKKGWDSCTKSEMLHKEIAHFGKAREYSSEKIESIKEQVAKNINNLYQSHTNIPPKEISFSWYEHLYHTFPEPKKIPSWQRRSNAPKTTPPSKNWWSKKKKPNKKPVPKEEKKEEFTYEWQKIFNN